MTTIDEFTAGFGEEPGYLDFAKVGPVGRSVRDEEHAQSSLLARSRHGTLDTLVSQDARLRSAVSRLIGFRDDQVVFQPSTSQGIMHAAFGLTGQVALAATEFPSNTVAVTRAAEVLGVVSPLWLDTDRGRVTPGIIRDQITPATVAVLVSLVDYRTGYLTDLEGIRQVIGDRLLIVDAMQGFGVVDAPWEFADVIASGGRKWVRAGWGTGFLALNDRAKERLTPVFSGFTGTDLEWDWMSEVPPPVSGAAAFQLSHGDPIAMARFSAALEDIADVGVETIAEALADRVSRIIDLADEFGIAVTSSRDRAQRAGIVVLEPPADTLAAFTAAMHNHGVTVTVRGETVRISPHASTSDETLLMLKSALIAYSTTLP